MRAPIQRLWWLLLGVGAVAGAGFVASRRRTAPAEGLAVSLRIEADQLRLPGGHTCPLAHAGCQDALAALSRSDLRLTAPGETPFGLATPVLRAMAEAHRTAVLDEGVGPVRIRPARGDEIAHWASAKNATSGIRLRVILRADGIWLGVEGNKLLGADPRGPTLVPTEQGQDFGGLERKIDAFKSRIGGLEGTCALLPSLDVPYADVVRAARLLRQTFPEVLVAVP